MIEEQPFLMLDVNDNVHNLTTEQTRNAVRAAMYATLTAVTLYELVRTGGGTLGDLDAKAVPEEYLNCLATLAEVEFLLGAAPNKMEMAARLGGVHESGLDLIRALIGNMDTETEN